MSIQSNINQGISLMSLLVSQTPLAEEARAKTAADVAENKAKEKVAEEAKEKEVRFKALEEHAKSGISADKTAAGEDAELEVYGDFAKLAKERYLANPTEETYADYMTYGTGYREAAESLATKRVKAAESLSTKRAEAEDKAKMAAEEEARRLAISRSITEGVYSTDPAFDPRYTGGKKK